MNDASCCQEFERAAGLSRRRFLGGMAAGAGLAVATTTFGDVFRQTAFGAGSGSGNNVLVVISLRGGIDGLSVVVPRGTQYDLYAALRKSIAVPERTLLTHDQAFGLHPSMRPLLPFWNSGKLAAVQAVGLAVPDRSHFSAMEVVEDAAPGSSARTGWINRAIGLDSDAFPTEAVQFGTSIVPTALTGSAPTIATQSIRELYLAGANPEWDDVEWMNRRRTQLQTVWGGAKGGLAVAARSALATVEQMAPYRTQTYQPHNAAVYPSDWPAGDLSAALQNTAQLIRADVGTEVVAVDYGSWDMHTDIGTVDSGDMRSMLGGFARSLAAFLTDLGDTGDRVTVVTISEFGRRVEVNGGGGVDHGWGNMMLVAGGGVRGRSYYGSWPGLASSDLVEGDLKVTTDYRNILAEIVRSRFNRTEASVFPGLTYAPLDIMVPWTG